MRSREPSPFRIVWVSICLLGAGRVTAVEPGPDQGLLTIEAKILPSQVSLMETPMALCLQNVNRRTSPGLALLPGDSFTFRIDPVYGAFSATNGCPSSPSIYRPEAGVR